MDKSYKVRFSQFSSAVPTSEKKILFSQKVILDIDYWFQICDSG